MLTLHISSLCRGKKRATGITPQRSKRERNRERVKCCAERLTDQQVQRLFYDVHTKHEDRYFWCPAGVEKRGIASMGKERLTRILHNIRLFVSRIGHAWLLPLAFFLCDFTHWILLWHLWAPVWARWSWVLQMFGLWESLKHTVVVTGLIFSDRGIPIWHYVIYELYQPLWPIIGDYNISGPYILLCKFLAMPFILSAWAVLACKWQKHHGLAN